MSVMVSVILNHEIKSVRSGHVNDGIVVLEYTAAVNNLYLHVVDARVARELAVALVTEADRLDSDRLAAADSSEARGVE